jgi:hypothetical protein
VVGIAVLASNLGVGIWGAVAWARATPSVAFWYALRFAQTLVVIQVSLGAALLFTGHRPPDELHYVYGITPLLVTLFSEGMRVGAGQREIEAAGDYESLPHDEQVALARRVVRREMGVMAVGALLIATLSLRALGTGL